jgi:hypothetical protein
MRKYCQGEFPQLLSYQRSIELIPNALMPLIYYLNSLKGVNTDINKVDSTSITICHPKRAKTNQVFKGLAGWRKSSVCSYFGFRLHFIINDQGELLAFQITPINVDN